MTSGDGMDDGSEASKAGSDWDMERERDRGRQAPRRDDMPGRYRLDDETTDDIGAMTEAAAMTSWHGAAIANER